MKNLKILSVCLCLTVCSIFLSACTQAKIETNTDYQVIETFNTAVMPSKTEFKLLENNTATFRLSGVVLYTGTIEVTGGYLQARKTEFKYIDSAGKLVIFYIEENGNQLEIFSSEDKLIARLKAV